MTRKRPLSDDERVLWRTVTRAIAPLRGRRSEHDDVEAASVPVAAKARPLQLQPVTSVPSSSRPTPSLAPIDRRTRQKLARGTASIDGRIDLHGMTQAQAGSKAWSFARW
jgi:DNA-nicking Smr family endonuclease